jgi:glycogen operon protein
VASINFVTCHDGFTLHDLVSYNSKHNEANGENNRDGTDDNRSWNCGVEGPTKDEAVLALRAKQKRNFIATMFLSQGVPMLCHGDELGRTQKGNNNGYCQDNEVTWIDWRHRDEALEEFTQRVSQLRHEHPILRRRRFFDGLPVSRGKRAGGLPDIAWFTPDGREMTNQDWGSGFGRSIGVFLNGGGIPDLDARGARVRDDDFMLMFNAHDQAIAFKVPDKPYPESWVPVLATAPESESDPVKCGEPVLIPSRSLLVLQREA